MDYLYIVQCHTSLNRIQNKTARLLNELERIYNSFTADDQLQWEELSSKIVILFKLQEMYMDKLDSLCLRNYGQPWRVNP